MSSVIQTIQSLGYELPPAPQPAGSYVPAKEINGLLYISGQVSKLADGKLIEGCVGRDLDLSQGQSAAEACALNAVSVLKEYGYLEKVEEIVRVTGYVQCDSAFKQIPQVINGASDLLIKIFGEKGKHVRSAVGVYSLPMNAAVELEITLKLRGESI